MKKFLASLIIGFAALITFFNLLPYIFVNIDTSTILTPRVISINGKEIDDEKNISKIYGAISNGRVKETTTLMSQSLVYGSVIRIKAHYEEDEDLIGEVNDIKKGHLHKFKVLEDDTISFEYYIDDSLKAKDLRVVTIKSKGIYEYVKSLK